MYISPQTYLSDFSYLSSFCSGIPEDRNFPSWAEPWFLPLAAVSCGDEFHVLIAHGVKKAAFSPALGLGWAAGGSMPIKNDASALLVVEDCSSGLFLKK